ncbi:hypothetical protein QTI66_08630 [Variovorax sp. J22R133]|uniref:hypothetical protein n=1 Tax=Variovorax brevis TaxID=3053503 RepID=UPI002575D74B|nr:hypothetical protein [Variovorax sp. J22R133]MDM0112213.1 hypothetical protein [Variovorax sp. J22R133]
MRNITALSIQFSQSISSKCVASFAVLSLLATSAHARRRGGGGGGSGEDHFPWLTDLVIYVLLGLFALSVVGALWRYFTRPSAADMARERSMRRQSMRQPGRRR